MITGKRMVAGSQLTTSIATYYPVGTAMRSQIQAAMLVNTTAGPATATVHLVPSGGTATALNMILSAKSIAAGESYKCIEMVGQWLEAGGTIQALAGSGAVISFIVSGIEVT